MQVASARAENPYDAGRAAALALREKMGDVRPHAVIMAECFEEKSSKSKVLKGAASVFPRDAILGCATYGSFAQEGCLDMDSVSLLGIGGKGIAVGAALVQNMNIGGLTMEEHQDELKSRLHSAGEELAQKLPRSDRDRLMIIMPDAHSPKNQFLVEGVQEVLGKEFPLTGGSANKNTGQTYVYYRGRMFEDSAVGLMLSGNFQVSLAGRMAKSNDAVIATARQSAAEAVKKLRAKPFALLAFNCAGRKGKLDDITDELTAIQEVIGRDVPLFGTYCAGEIGPADQAEAQPGVLSSGVGWHVMFTALGPEF
jgi:hypothetical protein